MMAGKKRRLAIQMLLLAVVLLTALSLRRNAFYSDPVALWRETVRTSPNRERPHYNLGTELKNVGLLDQARPEWERTIELNPRHSQALNQLGSYWLLKKEYEKAERYYVAAVQADTNNVEACYNLAMTFELRGNTSQALYYYDQFLKKAPPEFQDLLLSVSRKVMMLKEAKQE